MAGFMDANTNFLTRSNIWSRQIKELLLDELNAMRFVRMISDFPDGFTINIPSIGEATQADYVEGQAIKYNTMDTGNFVFSFTQYKYSANAISEKFKRDSYYSQDVIASFVPRQHRVLMEGVETRILSVANSNQTASATNAINGAIHRWVGSGSGNTIAFKYFALARNSLFKANVPLRDLVCIMDPATAYTLETQTNVVNLLSPNRQWGPVVDDGIITGFKFVFNVYGFDCYISNYLPTIASETISGSPVNTLALTSGMPNYFFSAAPGDTLPWIGAFRQLPTVYSEFNKDLQQEEYLTVAEWGFKLYRPENLVTILTNTTAVPS